jgi:hypothetical protein
MTVHHSITPLSCAISGAAALFYLVSLSMALGADGVIVGAAMLLVFLNIAGIVEGGE